MCCAGQRLVEARRILLRERQGLGGRGRWPPALDVGLLGAEKTRCGAPHLAPGLCGNPVAKLLGQLGTLAEDGQRAVAVPANELGGCLFGQIRPHRSRCGSRRPSWLQYQLQSLPGLFAKPLLPANDCSIVDWVVHFSD